MSDIVSFLLARDNFLPSCVSPVYGFNFEYLTLLWLMAQDIQFSLGSSKKTPPPRRITKLRMSRLVGASTIHTVSCGLYWWPCGLYWPPPVKHRAYILPWPKFIWNSISLSKTTCFGWRLLHNKTPT